MAIEQIGAPIGTAKLRPAEQAYSAGMAGQSLPQAGSAFVHDRGVDSKSALTKSRGQLPKGESLWASAREVFSAGGQFAKAGTQCLWNTGKFVNHCGRAAYDKVFDDSL